MREDILLVGIDAGGTKTDVVLCNGAGEVLGRTFRGTGNPNDIGTLACAQMMLDGIRELCGERTPDAVFAGVSGAGSGNNSQEIRRALLSALQNSRVEVGTDALNLLASGKSEGDTAALICGTGTALFLERKGELKRIGGWGYLFDDGGSAYDLGRGAIRAALAVEEGLIEDCPLYRRLTESLGRDAHASLADIYKGGKAHVASFAQMTVECAESGDGVAQRILMQSVSAIGKRVELAVSLYGDIPELVSGGGLFNSAYFTSLLSEEVRAHGAELYIPSLPQSFGACVRAAALCGKLSKSEFEARFASTLPKV